MRPACRTHVLTALRLHRGSHPSQTLAQLQRGCLIHLYLHRPQELVIELAVPCFPCLLFRLSSPIRAGVLVVPGQRHTGRVWSLLPKTARSVIWSRVNYLRHPPPLRCSRVYGRPCLGDVPMSQAVIRHLRLSLFGLTRPQDRPHPCRSLPRSNQVFSTRQCSYRMPRPCLRNIHQLRGFLRFIRHLGRGPALCRWI